MKLTGGQALVAQLIREGVVDVFGIPGVQLDWAVDALRLEADRIRFVVPRHEQAASYMADGYARTTDRVGVSMVVPGPGVLNALSGLATGYACSSRMLFIGGHIASDAIGKGYGLLHEIPDQSGILRSLTKWSACAASPEEVPEVVHEAFKELRSGHPRPVAIEIPPDVLQKEGDMRLHDMAETAPVAPSDSDIRRAAALLQTALFPVIHAGGGAAAGRAGAALTALAEKLQAPVCMTEGGRGLVSDRHPLALTTLGERAVLPHADVVLVLGSRFLNALGRPTHVSDKTRFIYVNLDENHLGAPRQEGLSICADAGLTAAALLKALADFKPYRKREQDIAKVRAWQFEQTSQVSPQNAYAAVLREALGDDGILVSELTQIGYYSNIAMPVYESGTLVTPGYQGTLGYGFPTSLGAAAGNPDRRVISITGDGGFGWGMQELSTLARYGFDVTVVVFADGRYGNVQRIQRRTFGAEFATELMNPDFGALAAAFGIPARRAETPEELAAALVRPAGARGPLLVEAVVGEMPSPWALIHPFVPPASPPPPNPLGEAT